jgi:drug/metabolite transporter (DMT)-like permease
LALDVSVDRPARAFALSLVSSAAFAGMFACHKLLPAAVTSMQSLFGRGVIGVLACALLLRAQRASFRTSSPRVQFLRAACGATAILCQYYAIHEFGCELATATLLNLAAPLWILLFSGPVLGERPGPRTHVALALGLIGAALALAPSHPSERIGLALALASGAFSAAALLSVRHLAARENPDAVVLYFMAFATVITGPFAIGDFARGGAWGPRDVALFLAVGVLGTFGQLVMTRAYRYASAATTSIAGLAQVFFAGILSFFVIGDRPPSWIPIAGGLLVLVAGLIATEPWRAAKDLRSKS